MFDTASPAPHHTRALVAKTCLHTLLLPGTVLIGLPWLVLELLPGAGRFGIEPFPGRLLATFVLAFIAGAVAFSWDFITKGDGTPNPLDPPKRLVVTGLYRFVRNPGYLAVWAMLAGEALYFGSTSLLLYTLFAITSFHAYVVRIEEPGLRARFAEEYDSFCSDVPRWIPKLSAWGRE